MILRRKAKKNELLRVGLVDVAKIDLIKSLLFILKALFVIKGLKLLLT